MGRWPLRKFFSRAAPPYRDDFGSGRFVGGGQGGGGGRPTESPDVLAAMRSAKARVSAALLREPLAARAAAQRERNPPTIVGVGIGKKVRRRRALPELAIRFYVVRKLPKDRLAPGDLLPTDVEGFTTDVEAVGHIIPYCANRRVWRPVKGGVSISLGPQAAAVPYAGTLGCWTRDAVDRSLFLGLSNNHVLANENRASAGDPVVQPGTLDSPLAGAVGTLARFKPIDFAGGRNAVDAAVFAPTQPALVDLDILRVGTPTGAAEAARGQRVVKSGRTTKVTRGTVVDVDADIQVQYESGAALFESQVAATGVWYRHFSKAGDSGSAILEEGSLKVVGLLFAGSDLIDRTFANPIGPVFDALGLVMS